MATFHKAPPYRTQTEEKVPIHWSLTSCILTEVLKRTVSRKSSPELCGGKVEEKSADELYLSLKREKKAHLMEGTSQYEQKAEQGR